MAKHFLGKFMTRKATSEEIATAASAARLEPDDLSDSSAPHIYGVLLDSYGPDKLAEVEEALEIAAGRGLGDIANKLADWIIDDSRAKARGIMGLRQATLGTRSTEDTEGVVAQNITGIKGPVSTQLKVLEQRIQKATDAARRAMQPEEGGRRKTRRRKAARRKTRIAKKSRRTYK